MKATRTLHDRKPILDVDALVDLVAARVLTKIGRVTPEVFRSTGPLPPGVSRRTFLMTCRSGRVADVTRDGRVVACTADAWRAARSVINPPRTGAREDVGELAAGFLEAAGIRSTRDRR